eukprot:3134399-Pleurochrysis_carterae.AAC.1
MLPMRERGTRAARLHSNGMQRCARRTRSSAELHDLSNANLSCRRCRSVADCTIRIHLKGSCRLFSRARISTRGCVPAHLHEPGCTRA